MQSSEDAVAKLTRIMRVSSRVRLDMLQDALRMSASEFNQQIFVWAEDFNFRIDGDFVDFEGGDLGGFVAELDAAFANWTLDGSSKYENSEKTIEAIPQPSPSQFNGALELSQLRKAFFLENLDEKTREFMSKELDSDMVAGDIYLSNRLTDLGLKKYPTEEEIPDLEVYRAKFVNDPRPQSQRVVGMRVDPKSVLELLRKNKTVDSVLGLSPGPNSGLSVRLLN
ncbi:MAG TPA: hypothetical protein VKK79_10175 [Candidatus Lokiarchaeia archaeon]|nr:hypothetical protein [Candidatus Lokiarchaeia archaeon]